MVIIWPNKINANNLINKIMTLSELKNSLAPFMANKEYDGAADLLYYWNGCSDITINDVDGYNCSLGNVISTLDAIGVYHELKGLGSDSGMYIYIPICK